MDIVVGACMTVITGVLQECAVTRRAIVRPFRWCSSCSCCCTRQAGDYESLYGSQYEEDFSEHNATGTAAGQGGANEQQFGVNGYDSQHPHNAIKEGHYRHAPPMKPSYGATTA